MKNRAERMNLIFSRARKTGEAAGSNTNAHTIWGKVFGFSFEYRAENMDMIELCRRLSLVNDELTALRAEMSIKKSLPDQLLDNCLDPCVKVLDPLNLSSRWSKRYGLHLDGTVTASLSNWSHMLGRQEKRVPSEQLDAALENLRSFEKEVRESTGIGGKLKAFLLEQIRILKRTIEDYEIQGAWTFEAKNRELGRHATQYRSIFEEEEEKGGEGWEMLNKMFTYWKRLSEFASHAETTSKLIVAAPEAIDAMEKFVSNAG